MDQIRQIRINDLQQARQELLGIRKESLDHAVFRSWASDHWNLFYLTHQMDSGINPHTPSDAVNTYQGIDDPDILLDLRKQIVEWLDRTIGRLDRETPVRPILDDLILQVADRQISTLLKEFNAVRESSPNLAALGFRTIISVIIIHRARKVQAQIPQAGSLASKTDFNPESVLRDGLAAGIFSDAETRRLKRFLDSGRKDSMDFVAHKVGSQYLMSKDNLEDAVELLNSLLPTII